MILTIKCPECFYAQNFEVDEHVPLAIVPEIAKELMCCNCKNGIPKINKNTPVLGSLIGINGVSTRKLLRVKKEKTRVFFNGRN